ncbi:hypothetical protein GQ54DRAFT_299926 [Martensiomyces pterosporus]|nr:hypothetical protein GQ54DRAFT_299926 [Martensiomyces pterosporus]
MVPQQQPHLHHQQAPLPPAFHASETPAAAIAAGHMVPPVPYGIPASTHDPYNMRSYHHPDTPGGLDGRAHTTPFAFFKQPLGATVSHPSAYTIPGEVPGSASAHGREHGIAAAGTDQKARRPVDGGSSGPSQVPNRPLAPASATHGRLGIKDRRPVPPAVSGLSVRIMANDHSMSDSPRSAPVDGPNQLKRKISHDEVMMALRRKVMSKGKQVSALQQQQLQQQPQPSASRNTLAKPASSSDAPTSPTVAKNCSQQQQASSSRLKAPQGNSRKRRSSLAVVADITTSEAVPSSSDSSSSSSEEESPLGSNASASARIKAAGIAPSSQQASNGERLPSISTIIDAPAAADNASSQENR